MKVSRTVSFGMGVLVALVVGSGTAYAATGGDFILGKSNKAKATTTLSNSKGTPLSLKAKPGKAPLAVNSTTKVGNLNSDRLDGLDSTAFALSGGQSNTVRGRGLALDLDEDGVSDTIVALAQCPAGTRLTGGGGDDYTSGYLYVNSPGDKSSWIVFSTADVETQDPSDVVAYAICYNPRGAVPGGLFRSAAPTKPSEAQLDLIKARGLKKLR